MRNFEERKAEIFRRSEGRIRLRKRRQKQLLGVGVPLMCVAVCLAVLLPGKADNAAVDEMYSLQLDGLMDDAPAEMPEPVEGGVPVEGCAPEEAYVEETAAAERKQTQADEQGSYGSDYEGVYLQISEIDLNEGKIETLWSNHTEHTVFFGEPYDIQRYVDGQWISCATRLLDFPMPQYVLEKSEEISMTYATNFQWFDLSEPGLYRITAEFEVDGNDTAYTLWAEFTLREEGEANEETADTCIGLPLAG